MNLLLCSLAALAVAGLYYSWRDYHGARERRHRTLRERVAYMLWVMANRTV
jgi:hypothetical protein